MTVCVVGLGKIGLPLAVQFASKSVDVIGADLSEGTIDLISSGTVPFPGEHDLDLRLAEVLAAGRLRCTTDTAQAVSESDVVVVVVPLLVDDSGRPDFAALDAATADIGRGLTSGTLVVYETTLPVGVTRGRFVPALERHSGLRFGDEFSTAFSPERVYSGRIFADLRRYPKIVGGVDERSRDLAIAFYERVLDFDERHDLARPNGVWDVGSAEAAELTKLAETTFRDVNIAFANELATYASSTGIDVFDVIHAANSQPFSHIHQPGIAVGGHCIPVYPRLLLSTAPDMRIPELARTVNLEMPERAVEQLGAALAGLVGARVAVLGAAYRGGVKETAFSGVFDLVRLLTAAGAQPVVHDPLYSDEELARLGFSPFHLGEPVDGAIVQADHAEYRDMQPSDLPGLRAIYDGRQVTTSEPWSEAGITHIRLGRVGPRP